MGKEEEEEEEEEERERRRRRRRRLPLPRERSQSTSDMRAGSESSACSPPSAEQPSMGHHDRPETAGGEHHPSV